MRIITLTPIMAEAYVKLGEQLEAETDFLLYGAGERQMSVEQAESMLESIQEQENAVILAAENAGELIGHIMCIGGRAERNRHTVQIVTGVLKMYQGQGVASQMFSKMEEWARKNQVHRIELTVMVHNEPAIQLYKKAGFIKEGVKRDSLYVNHQWVDEYAMAKIL
ncbi:Protein N-acetyltransferase, RimJ/RimL family [Halobacillus alkaliphilus]|uniref:Protein N-acetyltransferase, RimJ/RimL family n=1 Tax=Halobacillus alkaliphilus TaxID=396056 RepID=A0A1I2RRH0_9BACI|nr:GNAT family N-acetyltransferase [Halobacillus alkaliphilus]SFG43112.1 Protein N-acetyltransferase, RimJ/RimL family [Halobacillus alkaliphilus]